MRHQEARNRPPHSGESRLHESSATPSRPEISTAPGLTSSMETSRSLCCFGCNLIRPTNLRQRASARGRRGSSHAQTVCVTAVRRPARRAASAGLYTSSSGIQRSFKCSTSMISVKFPPSMSTTATSTSLLERPIRPSKSALAYRWLHQFEAARMLVECDLPRYPSIVAATLRLALTCAFSPELSVWSASTRVSDR